MDRSEARAIDRDPDGAEGTPDLVAVHHYRQLAPALGPRVIGHGPQPSGPLVLPSIARDAEHAETGLDEGWVSAG